jgi:hypothetical protein
MIRIKLLNAILLIAVIFTLFTQVACGKKNSNNTTDIKSSMNTENESATDNFNKSSIITFDYTDEIGNTYILKGKAVSNESGDVIIEVIDADGNKVIFTGKATMIDGKMSVSNIAVQGVENAGINIKSDDCKVKVSTESIASDDNERTDNEAVSGILISDDVKNEMNSVMEEEIIKDNIEIGVPDNNCSYDVCENVTETPSISDIDDGIYEPTGPLIPNEKAEESSDTTSDVFIISGVDIRSGEVINKDVYITYNGNAVFNNVTVNGNIYCYGILKCSQVTVKGLYTYAYNGMASCSKSDGVRGVSGGLNCNKMYIQDDALDYAFSRWGNY